MPRKISSNSVQENASIEAKPATIIEDNSSASSSDTDENIKPSHNFRNESPEQNQENHELNGRRSTNGIDITKIYTQGMDNNNKKTINNNNNNVEKMGETRTKPTRDITQIYTQGKKKSIIGLLPTRKFLLAANRTLSGCLSVANRVLTGFA